jgi:hypothetical protein
MAACPYHVRVFNWWDPTWPKGMKKYLNPDVYAVFATTGSSGQETRRMRRGAPSFMRTNIKQLAPKPALPGPSLLEI